MTREELIMLLQTLPANKKVAAYASDSTQVFEVHGILETEKVFANGAENLIILDLTECFSSYEVDQEEETGINDPTLLNQLNPRGKMFIAGKNDKG